jgi:hypothetical protein
MNTSKLDVTSILSASIEDQMKIDKAATAAREAFKSATKLISIEAKAASTVVSTIQKTTAQAASKKLADAKKLQEETYKTTLVSLGLTAEAYPMETALIVADQKIAAPVLGLFGKIGKLGAGIGKYVGGHVKNGYVK